MSEQKQKAGDNSAQIQIGTQIVNVGPAPYAFAEAFEQQYSIVRKDIAEVASMVAEARVSEFYRIATHLFEKIDKLEEKLKEPSVLQTVGETIYQAAASTEARDLETLAELLGQRIELHEDRKRRLVIKKAIPLVNDIDEQALACLTTICILDLYVPTTLDLRTALQAMDKLLGNVVCLELPKGDSWERHLITLGVMERTAFNLPRGKDQIIQKKFSKTYKYGWSKGSGIEENIKNIIENFYPDTWMLDKIINHPVLEDYSVINPQYILNAEMSSTINQIDGVAETLEYDVRAYEMLSLQQSHKLSEAEQMKAVQQITGLLNDYPNLKMALDLYSRVTNANINDIGYAIAYANLRRLHKEVPLPPALKE